MVSINYAFREISCKIVYYGPGLSGKTTNLQYVHDRLPSKSRGDLISLATEADRTLYFDFLPLHVGDIGGFATKFQMYTVPGQVFYNATRKLVLRGVDGIVFVADSQNAKMDENLESLADMYDNLKSYSIDPATMPIVMQYNKRDLPDVASIEELEQTLNREGRPYVEATAVTGVGVFDTVKRISKLVLEDIRRRTEKGPAADTPPPPATASETPVVSRKSLGRTPDVRDATLKERPVPHAADVTPAPAAVAVAAPPAVKPAAATGEKPQRDTAVLPDENSDDTPADARQRVQAPSERAVRPAAPRPGGSTIIAAQKSTKIRRRKRTLFDRLFGWLFGR